MRVGRIWRWGKQKRAQVQKWNASRFQIEGEVDPEVALHTAQVAGRAPRSRSSDEPTGYARTLGKLPEEILKFCRDELANNPHGAKTKTWRGFTFRTPAHIRTQFKISVQCAEGYPPTKVADVLRAHRKFGKVEVVKRSTTVEVTMQWGKW